MSPLSDPPSSPPSTSARFERDEDGLVKGLSYRYKLDGTIDWVAMVDRKYLYVIKDKEAAVVAAQGKPLVECDLLLVNPRWLRIKLAGLLQLANWRGYTTLTYPQFVVSDSKAAVVAEMTFIGNYETSGYPIVASGIGSACRLTMDKDFMGHLEAFAENRAFARCVKRALQIETLSDVEVEGKDEVVEDGADLPDSSTSGFKPHEKLKEKCLQRETPLTFEKVREAATKYATELETDPTTWTDWSSILPRDAWLIIGKLEKAVVKRGKA